MAGPAAAQWLKDEGFEFVRGYEVKQDDDIDYVGWWRKSQRNGWRREDHCFLNFQGSDSKQDFDDDFDSVPISVPEWGLENVHRGLVTELKVLVSQIDFAG